MAEEPLQKYYPKTWFWPELDAKPWFLAWNHWLNPLGNWLEPMPRPQGRVDDAYRSLRYKFWKLLGLPTFGVWFFWATRNFAPNFFQFWIGIKPVGERYVHHAPEENGWQKEFVDTEGAVQFRYWWKKFGPLTVKLPYLTARLPFDFEAGIGWKSSGGFGSHFRHD
jgi:hypothetical protein